MTHRLIVMLTLAGVALGCVEDLDLSDPPEVSAATIARFAPDSADPCKSVMPFPTDLIKDPATGKLNIPFCPGDDATMVATKIGLRTLDGYSINGALYTFFSGTIQEGSTLGNTFLLNTSTGTLVPAFPYFRATDKQLILLLGEVLEPETTYIAALTKGIKDSKGNDVIVDQTFSFVLSAEPLVDADGYSLFPSLTNDQANAAEALRQAYAPIFDALAAAPVSKSRDEILVAWSFTTQTVYGAMPGLGTVVGSVPVEVDMQNSLPAAEHLLLAATGLPIDNLDMIYTGTLTLTSLLTRTGTFGVDKTGAPIVERLPVDYLLITPRDTACPGSWDWGHVAVYAHALGRCKNDALALANTLAGLCYATLALDGPKAGSRTVGTLGDQDADGCPDQPAIPEFVSLDGSINPFAIRDHVREWGLELVLAADVAATRPEALAGDLDPTATADVAMIGHSWGGMAATHAASLSSDIDLLVTLAASGSMGAMFEPLIEEAMIESLTAAGVDLSTEEGQAALDRAVDEALATFVWAMESGDPLYAAPEVSQPVLPMIVTGGGAGDVQDASLHDQSTQGLLTEALGVSRHTVTYILACTDSGSTIPICDDAQSVLASMFVPCVADQDAPLYTEARDKLGAMQGEIVRFIATGTLCTGLDTGGACQKAGCDVDGTDCVSPDRAVATCP